MHLEHAAFESDPTLWSMPWRQVQSTKPCPAWYSPGSTNWMVPFGDLMMLRDIADLGLPYEAVGREWLGCPLKLENMIAFKYEKLARLNGWYLGLQHLDTSIVLAWPLTRCQMPGCDGVFYYEPVFSVKEPVGIFISEVSDLQACALAGQVAALAVERVGAVSGCAPALLPALPAARPGALVQGARARGVLRHEPVHHPCAWQTPRLEVG